MKQAPGQPYYAPARFPLMGGEEGGGGSMRVVMIRSNFGYEIKTNDDQNIQTKHNELNTEQISQQSRSTLKTVYTEMSSHHTCFSFTRRDLELQKQFVY